jgi:hypothetical protein
MTFMHPETPKATASSDASALPIDVGAVDARPIAGRRTNLVGTCELMTRISSRALVATAASS